MNPDDLAPEPTAPKPSLEMVLAQQANAAIGQGADPKAVSDLLTSHLRYVRSNPAERQQAEGALNAGADPRAVAGLFFQRVASDPMARYHEQAQAGTLQKDIAAKNAAEMQAAGLTTPTALPSASRGGLGKPRSAMERIEGQQALSGLIAAPAAALRDVYGGEALQAGARALARNEPYRQALSEIHAAEEETPDVVRKAMRVGGAGLATAALPGSPVAQGALYGGLSGLLQANPDAGVSDRLVGAGVGTAAGALGGKAAQLGGTLLQSVLGKTLGKQAVNANAVQRAKDALAYGQAEAEGAAVGSTPAIRAVLNKPGIKEYADVVRQSETFKNANDATVLREAYKLMSEQSVKRGQVLAAGDFKAGTSLAKSDLDLLKTQMREATQEPGQVVIPGRVMVAPAPSTAQSPPPSLRDALEAFKTRSALAATRPEGTVMQQTARQALERHGAENIVSPALRGAPSPMQAMMVEPQVVNIPAGMPSFPAAVAQHAQAKAEQKAWEMGADAAKRQMLQTSLAAKNQGKKSIEGVLESLKGLPLNEAQAFLQGVLGRAREAPVGSVNPLKGFGIGPSAVRLNRLQPLIDAARQQAGQARVPFLQSLGAGALTYTPNDVVRDQP